jgi:ATP-dependent helicase HrpA
MAAELVETGRLYARIVAKIEPEWIEPVAGDLIKRQYSDPHWEKKAAQVVAFESVSLYGLPVVTRRRMHYGPIDRPLSNEIFIREALVNGDWHNKAPFFHHNRQLIHDIEVLEQKSRRRDVLVDEDILFDFYRARIPADIINGAGFEKWRKQAEKKDAKLLFLSREQLMQHQAEQVTVDNYPDQMLINRVPLPLEYHFEPGKQHDGITQTIPLSLLNQTNPQRYQWLVPGLLRDKIIFLIKALPKSLRRHFIPVPQYADQCLQHLSPESGDLLAALSEQLRKLTGVEIEANDWRTEELPLYLQMNFRLVDDNGKLLAESRDLEQLKQDWAKQAAASFRQIPDSDYEQRGLTGWSFNDLPEQITLEQNGLQMTAYPALVDKGDNVDLTLMDTAGQARSLTHLGLRRLFMLAQADAVKYLSRNLPGIQQMCLHYANVPPSPFAQNQADTDMTPCEQLKTDLIHVAFDRCFLLGQPAVRNRQQFEQRLNEKRSELIKIASDLALSIASPLAEYHAIAKRLGGKIPLTAINAISDIREQLGYLIYQGFVHDTPDDALERLPVYCQAAGIRLDKLLTDPLKDKQRMTEVLPHWQRFTSKADKLQTQEFRTYRWMLEEFRISVFAQELKTAYPVSAKRLEKQWQSC